MQWVRAPLCYGSYRKQIARQQIVYDKGYGHRYLGPQTWKHWCPLPLAGIVVDIMKRWKVTPHLSWSPCKIWLLMWATLGSLNKLGTLLPRPFICWKCSTVKHVCSLSWLLWWVWSLLVKRCGNRLQGSQNVWEFGGPVPSSLDCGLSPTYRTPARGLAYWIWSLLIKRYERYMRRKISRRGESHSRSSKVTDRSDFLLVNWARLVLQFWSKKLTFSNPTVIDAVVEGLTV